MIGKLTELINKCDSRDVAIIRSGKHAYLLRLKDYDLFENDPRLFANPEAVMNLLHWLNVNCKYKYSPCGYHFDNFTIYPSFESNYVDKKQTTKSGLFFLRVFDV